MMTKAAHLKWAKERAMEYVKQNDIINAMASIASNLQKHPETRGHLAMQLMTNLYLAGHLDDMLAMANFIDGIN